MQSAAGLATMGWFSWSLVYTEGFCLEIVMAVLQIVLGGGDTSDDSSKKVRWL